MFGIGFNEDFSDSGIDYVEWAVEIFYNIEFSDSLSSDAYALCVFPTLFPIAHLVTLNSIDSVLTISKLFRSGCN